MPQSVVAVLLAAGAGSRFAGPTHKLLAPLGARTVFEHAFAHVMESAIGPVVVITGAADLSVPTEFAGDATIVTIVHNDAWRDGQGSSLALAVDHATRLGIDHIVMGLGDQPFIDPEAWRLVAGAPPEWPIVVASYHGRRGPHPVRLHRSVWPLLPRTGDDGARTPIRSHPHLVHEVACPGSATDIDTLEDVARWKSS